MLLDSARRTKKEAATYRDKNQSELPNQISDPRGEIERGFPGARDLPRLTSHRAINLEATKAPGTTFPGGLLGAADEVTE